MLGTYRTRILIFLLTLVSMSALVALVLVPLVPRIEAFSQSVRNYAVRELRNALGAEISFESVNPSIFNYLEVRGLELRNSQVQARVERVRVYYRIGDILRGDFAASPRDVRIDGADVRILAPEPRQQAVSLGAEQLLRQSFQIMSLLPDQSRMSFRFLRIQYADDSAGLSIDLDQGEVSKQGEAVSARLNMVGEFWLADQTVSTAGHLRLRSDPAAELAEVHLNLGRIDSSLGSVQSISLQGSVSPEHIRFAKTFDSQPFDLSLETDTSFSSLGIEFLAENWSPSSLVSLNPSIGDGIPSQLLGGVFDGSAQLRIAGDVQEAGAAIVGYETNLEYSGLVPGLDARGTLRLAAIGTERSMQVHELRFATNQRAQIGFVGTLDLVDLTPLGELNFNSGELFSMGQVSGTARFVAEPGGYSVRTTSLSIFGLGLENPAVSLNVAEKQIDYSVSFALQDGGTTIFDNVRDNPYEFAGSRGMVQVDGSFDNPLAVPLDNFVDSFVARLQIEDLRLARSIELLDLFIDPPAVLTNPDQANASVDATAYLFFRDGAPGFRVPNLRIQDFSEQVPEISLSGRFQDAVFVLDDLSLPINGLPAMGNKLSVQGRAAFLPGAGFTFYARSQIGQAPVELSGFFDQGVLSFLSNLGFRGVVRGIEGYDGSPDSPLELDMAAGSLSLSGIEPLKFADRAEFSLSGTYVNPTSWQLQSLQVNIPSIPAPEILGGQSAVRFSAAGTSQNLTISDGSLMFPDDQFLFQGSLVSRNIPESAYGIEIDMTSADGQEAANLLLEIQDGMANASLTTSNLRLSRLPLDGIGGRGRLSAEFATSLGTEDLLGNSRGALRIDLTEGLFNLDPMLGTLGIELEDGVLRFQDSSLRIVDTRFELLEGTFDLRNRSTDIALRVDENIVIGFEGEGPELGSPGIQGLTGTLRIDNLPGVISPEPSIELAVQTRNSAIELTGGPSQSVFASFDTENGALIVRTQEPMHLQLEAAGTITDGEFDINIPNASWVDADLSQVFDFGVFTILRGDAVGNLRLVGDVNDPSFFGIVSVSGFEAMLEYSPQPLGPGSAFIIFEDKNLYFPEFRISAGSSTVGVEGSLGFDRWKPSSYAFSFSIDGNIPIVHDFQSVVVNGNATGSVQVSGDLDQVEVQGSITASQAAVTLSQGGSTAVESGDSDTKSEISVRLELLSDRGVVFFWPNQELPILRSFVNPGGSLVLSVNTGRDTYSLQGDLPVRGGEILYIDRNFYIREGGIIFNETQDGFNPRVTLKADTRTSWQGQRVQLTISVVENFLSDLQPRISSEPPLSQEALAVLVGGTLFPSADEANYDLVGEALLTSTDIASQFILLRDLETSIRNTFGLDLFSIRTGLFQNILRDLVLPDETTSYGNIVGRYLQNTTLQIGKYLGEDVFLELMLQLTENDPLTRAALDPLGLSLNPEFRVEWQTPFFLLEWNWQPSSTENLWVTDHRLIFSWDFN